MLAPHSPPWRHSGGFRPSRKWGRTAGDVSLPAPSAGGRRRIPRRRGGRLSLLRKNAPSSAVWSASLLRSVCQKEEGRGRSEVCVWWWGGTTTDAAFINMDDFGEGLRARPLLARRACQVPPSVPPTNWPFRLLLSLTRCQSRLSLRPLSVSGRVQRPDCNLYPSNLFPSGGACSPRPVWFPVPQMLALPFSIPVLLPPSLPSSSAFRR